ncbi:MAG: carboxypeptidase-like regulatory domain-containing protein [Actinomycetota bacterium]|nr:carboxypeptidase-like regulatory domain-containing protein [Actinomycetota bacterium]
MPTRWLMVLVVALVAPLAGAAPAAAEPEASGEISGVVRLADGTPLEGVAVQLWDVRGVTRGFVVATGPDGAFSAQVPASKYRAVVEADLHSPVGWHQTFAPGTTRPTEATEYTVRPGGRVSLELRVTPAAVITGRVVDATGNPVVGAHVVATAGQIAQVRSAAVSDADGRYRVLSLGSDRVTDLVVTKGSRVGARTVVTTADGSARAAKITLRERGRAKVVVNLGKRIHVSMLRLYDDAGSEVDSFRVTTSKRTTFTFDDLPPGRYWAVLHGTGKAVKVRVRPGSTTKVGPIRLTNGETTFSDESLGTIRKPNGKPAADAHITICAARAACVGAHAWDDGRYRFATPVPGTYRAVFTSGQGSSEFGHRWARVTTLRIDSRRGQHYPDITLQRTRKVTLLLTDRAGAPVKGVNAWLGDRMTSATEKVPSARGRVIWKRVPAARYRIGIVDESPYGYCDASRTVQKSGEDVTIRVVLDRCDGSLLG